MSETTSKKTEYVKRSRWLREAESLRHKLETMKHVNQDAVPDDPVEFCRLWLRYEPYPYMIPFLRDESHFIANLQARQTGKTYNGMAKILYIALRHPGSTILVTAPKHDQVKNIAFKHLRSHLNRMKTGDPALFSRVVGERNAMRTVIRLRNGSEILAESPVPETIRGHTAKAVYLMEMNFIREDEDLYTAILFTLDTPYGTVIGYLRRLQDNWERLASVHADQTGVGDYIVEDMKRSGIRNVTGVTFTETNKESMATALKETMRTAECPTCGWTDSLETLEDGWTTTCPNGCTSSLGNPQTLRPLLHIPYDPDLFAELNAPTYELAKTGRIQFNHPDGVHDDRFWALALANPQHATRPLNP
jgi:hypothetical protein